MNPLLAPSSKTASTTPVAARLDAGIPIRHFLPAALALILIFNWIIYQVHVSAVSPPENSNSGSGLWLVTLGLFLFLGAVAGTAYFFFQSRNPRTRAWNLAAGILCLVFAIGFFTALRLGQNRRLAGFPALGERSQPLVEAIEAYACDVGVPPPTLQALVPKYLPVIPSTGMSAYPDYDYDIDPEYWNGNPWVLYVRCGNIGLNFDRFLYFPLQNYKTGFMAPQREIMGQWAYEHE